MAERRTFRCDDAAGFQFVIVRANDSDFHLSVIPLAADFKREHAGEEETYTGCYGASVRIRVPMMGGGSHPALYHALAHLWNTSTASVGTQEGNANG